MKGFPGVKKYQDFCRKDVMEKGYILLNPKTGHKAYIYDYEELMDIKKQMSSPEWSWEEYRNLKMNDPNNPKVQMVRRYFKRKSSSEKQSINYRIQGTGALCFKLASILLFKYLRDNNLLFKVKFCIPVHDKVLLCLNCVNCWKLLKTKKLHKCCEIFAQFKNSLYLCTR